MLLLRSGENDNRVPKYGAADGSQPFSARDKSNALGGWLPSLTIALGITHHMKTFIPIFLLLGIAGALPQGITHWTKWVERPRAEARKIVEKAVTLKGGDSYQTVTNALGKRDVDNESGSDGVGPTQRLLHYNLSRPEGAGLESEHARYVQVYLDFKTGRVQNIFINASLQ